MSWEGKDIAATIYMIIYILQGTATRDDIDTTLKLGMNHPMGPLQLGTSYNALVKQMHLLKPAQPTCSCHLSLVVQVCFPDISFSSIGLDTCLAIQQTLYEGTRDSKYRPSVLLERMVDAQWYGKKNGKGFYEYK